MPSTSTIFRRKQKVDDPEKYEMYLEKQREKDTRRREEEKARIESGHQTRAQIEERNRKLEAKRERVRAYYHRKKAEKEESPRQTVTSATSGRPKSNTGKKPVDMSPKEYRAHKAELRRNQRAALSHQKKTAIRAKDRESKRQEREAKRGARVMEQEAPSSDGKMKQAFCNLNSHITKSHNQPVDSNRVSSDLENNLSKTDLNSIQKRSMDEEVDIDSTLSATGSSVIDTQDCEQLLSLLKAKDKEILKLKLELALCQEQLLSANSENIKFLRKCSNADLDHENEKLAESVERTFASVGVQVPEEILCQDEDIKPMPEWNVNTSDNSVNPAMIADILRETAEEEIQNQEKETAYDQDVNSNETGSETNSEYIYDSNSGYYYHPATGYYWEPTSGLFYDYTSCLFYWYNEKTETYEVYSGPEGDRGSNISSEKISETVGSTSKSKVKERRKKEKYTDGGRLRRRRKERNSKRKQSDGSTPLKSECINLKEEWEEGSSLDSNTKNLTFDEKRCTPHIDVIEGCLRKEEKMICESDSSDSLASSESELVSEVESGELISSSSEYSDTEIKEEVQDSDFHNPEEHAYTDAVAMDYPPCIRFIVQESESLPLGALYMVTCTGGTIGREESSGHALSIPDTSVSKIHAEIVYDYDNLCYQITDAGSQNGTLINERRLSKSKKKSSSQTLCHCDVLQIGNNTKLLVHIHKGYETCEDCEPGQVQAKMKARSQVKIKNTYQVLSKEERKIQQKQELKRIKKKFGLQNSHFESPGAVLNKEYSDKAELRRTLVGSENNQGAPERPANIHSPIATSNKGHKLLAKMGWKEGEGLGKSSSGIAEPINVELRLNQNAGLGSDRAASLSINNLQQADKVKRWNQARRRFDKLSTTDKELNSPDSHQIKSQASAIGLQNSDHSLPVQPLINTFSSLSENVPSAVKKETAAKRPGIVWLKGETQQPP